MLGVYDFCGHYEWTFEWLHQRGGEALVVEYWEEAICDDSQQHAARLILKEGFEGMKKYWGHILEEEAAGYHLTVTDHVFRIDMHECPSKGFLLRNNLEQYHDYCDHCMGWLGPLMKQAGYVIDHEHNHCGQCWWEIRQATDRMPPSKPGGSGGDKDVRLKENWKCPGKSIDQYARTTHPTNKKSI
jgi:hypothetical protein